MRNYSIFTWFGYDFPLAERASLIKAAGFDTVMLWWSDELQPPGADKETYPEVIRKLGLYIENVHLPLHFANDIWMDNLNGDDAYKKYETCINDCLRHGFPVAVMHPTKGQSPPPANQLGFDRIQKLADLAAKSNIVIALENLSQWQYLESIFSNVDSPGLGFCYDSGHDLLCCPKPYELPVKYADKLVALHIHDNMEDEDSHRLPLEGMINVHALVDSIIEAGYKGPLSLEVAHPKPGEEPLSYLKRAYGIATVLEKLRNYEY